MEERIRSFCKEFNLGVVIGDIIAVTGGYLHKMYHVQTECGEYAVKVLNPDIMKRPEALKNMINSEKVAYALKEKLPLVCARELTGNQVNEFQGNYYIVYDWQEGTSVFAPDISVMHCEKIGRLLGKMHVADVDIEELRPADCQTGEAAPEASQSESLTSEDLPTEAVQSALFPWDSYLAAARKQNASWLTVYENILPQLKRWNEQCVAGSRKLSGCQVLSHRDLDPKNVIWQEDEPVIIDWEAAGYVNPYQELVEVLNYWAVDETGAYDKDKFAALMKAYRESMNTENVDWEVVFESGYEGMLGWLEYNVKRALGLEGTSEKDVEQGTRQIFETVEELKRYQRNAVLIQEWLCEESM